MKKILALAALALAALGFSGCSSSNEVPDPTPTATQSGTAEVCAPGGDTDSGKIPGCE
ncbi:hypothetical protein [Actinobaculum massiliense]|uniref:hypothetical protein n=1 Tax=Actinobaculum massiliense TaxID=202789 RepID=UPI0002D41657|nr:hypothetical protein [Actinobaculum massiliense]MDK8318500.1 hypothetical protein [Actinobaculum massiliense]MDK8567001.1 hypothetical protein [Actinobaculum massiliense]